MRIQISQETYDLIRNMLRHPAFAAQHGFFDALLTYLEERHDVPELLQTGNMNTAEHKLMFLFFNSNIINENDRAVEIARFN